MVRFAPEARLQESSRLSPEGGVLAPIGGWNTRDPRGAMPEVDAEELDNWIPQAGNLESRRGYEEHGTGLSGEVESLMVYKYGATSTLIAAAGTTLYTIPSSAGAASSIATGKTNARWQYVNFVGYLMAVNGADAPISYSGSLGAPSYSGDLSAPEDMDGIHAHKSRLYMWDSGSSDFYYGGTNAISGAFTKFPLERVSTTGGNLMIVTTITHDGGSGADDYAAFILDTGEVLIYQGGNPGDAADWALVGKYMIPAPCSIRSAVKLGGDVTIATESDIISLLDVMKKGTETQGLILKPSKLSGAMTDAFRMYSANYGWQMQIYGQGRWMFCNVPVVSGATFHQYVVNTTTGAATRFTGMNARSWVVWERELYFGGNGSVYKADSGEDDDGSDIELVAKQASTMLGTPKDKRFYTCEFYISSDGETNIAASFAKDFADVGAAVTSSSATDGAEWDVAAWDEVDWAGTGKVKVIRLAVIGTGIAISHKLSASISGQRMQWYKTQYGFEVLTKR